MRRVHVVGAGLAGLAAALDLADAGVEVHLHEASPKAGGRCRSYFDEVLGRRVDNGSHLILTANSAVLSHAERIGAADRLRPLSEAAFPFVDLDTGRRWTIRLPRSPLGALGSASRPPGAGASEILRGAVGLLTAGPRATVAGAVRDRGPLWRGFWEPLCLAVLNTPPERASASLLRAALIRSIGRGAAAARPVLAPEGLGAALVDPALARLLQKGSAIRFRRPLEAVETDGTRATVLRIAGERVPLGPGDGVVLALPPQALAALLPGLVLPKPGHAILNAHFRLPAGAAEGAPPILGLLGGAAQWLFLRDDVVSVTISAAEAGPAWSLGRKEALARLWDETARALGLQEPPLAARLLRERWATFDQSPAGAARRAAGRTALRNLVLAGDHVATGLPATLEGAVLSGRRAAQILLG
ncbi:hydroxysqualene dehydroxylase HpnE [Rubellimicrobium sp. CFH 75288]|uniref:hydroxysqualene dehydroxylase HpnE n=1 Tax=Rubellimicrobium sp. CFH 75288 TaxID=2697034 RepID=UPI0014125A00|nr:NAD(P)-binding protein [Rubellimicrobium sp. CFH 75288]